MWGHGMLGGEGYISEWLLSCAREGAVCFWQLLLREVRVARLPPVRI
jgi:hypothetical protein